MPEYIERTYRSRIRPKGLTCFQVTVSETDLWVCARRDLENETRDLIWESRHQIETYIHAHPDFKTSLLPLMEDPYAPQIVREMIHEAAKVRVGPMAAVAGAIAQYVAEGLLKLSPEVIVENGGDIFLKAERPLTVSIFAGTSSLTGKLGLRLPTHQMPLGVCSSSGTVGHSLSRGRADAVCLLSASAALADSAATALGNRIHGKRDLERAADWASQIRGLYGGLVILGDALATWGDIELVGL